MRTKNQKIVIAIVIVMVIISDSFLWRSIFSAHGSGVPHEYFLDVGQGDSELVIFPGNVKILTDAGPTDAVVSDLEKVLPDGDDYIDLAVISHPQSDHFNGFNFLLDHYRFGAFIYNGRDDAPTDAAWSELKQKITAKHIPMITLGRGDVIRYEHNDDNNNGLTKDDSHRLGYEIDMLSPDLAFDQSAELNDTGLVELIKTPEFRTILTADTGFNIESWLIAQHVDIRADVLKVGHHGSKYSTSDAFLKTVNPSIAVIEVGAKNTYGQPGSSTLARIASSTDAVVFRTDEDGTVEIYPEGGKLKVVKEK